MGLDFQTGSYDVVDVVEGVARRRRRRLPPVAALDARRCHENAEEAPED